MTKSYKIEVADAAVRGMIAAGIPEKKAKVFHFLFQVVYNAGYNEAIREMKQSRGNYSDIISDGGMDPRI